MTSRARVAPAVPSAPTSGDGLDELRAELGQVEWLGPRLRPRRRLALLAALRRHVEAGAPRGLASQH